ncbi:cobyrinate a,c-diamide synthase [Clostridium sp. NSJ-6]|uniref:Cobyrinate a,c-diamide synthase n=1 Tax=Clostridium hominis TaxID=2763036 RepID=A0ABR7DDF8_9CLOT|nr:cobyrinate a,c-diamide synthase [Clostridium hominis]MBC5629426.1 cobyrinate a,c-diamide synthase [Clostridium hominis]
MKSIIISSNCSGGGKTTFTLGLMKLLKNKGYDVQGYKVGPDYIDSGFHSEITGKQSRNLDLHLMGEEGVKASFLRGSGDFGVIEGVMGLYDGVSITEKGSTYSISKLLSDTPIVLVLTPKAQCTTLAAEINGIKNFKNANIIGVVFNAVNQKYYELLKAVVEENCDVKVLGYIPKDDSIKLESRHLGLVQSVEVNNMVDKIERCAKLIEKNIDITYLLQNSKEVKLEVKDRFHLDDRKINIAIAYDEAFRFYYKENLELLEEIGNVSYFSPIKDEKLPENIDFLYLGGGYPEVFKEKLAQNRSMRNSIKEALEKGLKCYAECGGLMYLTERIEDCEMVGFFRGYTYMTKSLQRFGYSNVEIQGEKININININCHEFHKSDVDIKEERIYNVTKESWNGNTLKWNCGYKKENTIAGYPHIHFFGNMEFLKWLIE